MLSSCICIETCNNSVATFVCYMAWIEWSHFGFPVPLNSWKLSSCHIIPWHHFNILDCSLLTILNNQVIFFSYTLFPPGFLTCSSCTEQFLNAEAVRLHRAKAHPKEPSHQCTYCPEAFFDHPSLVNHNRIHLGGRPYICTTCGNRFSKISDLKRHERIHSGW